MVSVVNVEEKPMQNGDQIQCKEDSQHYRIIIISSYTSNLFRQFNPHMQG
jgi:hypothetical protein